MQGLFLSTPSARRATGCCHERVIALEFLSTPSARRATCCPSVLCSSGHISIHALREEGDLFGVAYNVLCAISIHALREEGDPFKFCARPGQFEFLSTPSARRATLPAVPQFRFRWISIHALREEGDHISEDTAVQ